VDSGVFILPVADDVAFVVGRPDIEGGGVFHAGPVGAVLVGIAVGVCKMARGVCRNFVSYVEWTNRLAGFGKGDGAACACGGVGVVNGFILFEGVADGGDFGFGFVAVGFLVDPADGGEREAGEEGDDGDRNKEFDQREALQA